MSHLEMLLQKLYTALINVHSAAVELRKSPKPGHQHIAIPTPQTRHESVQRSRELSRGPVAKVKALNDCIIILTTIIMIIRSSSSLITMTLLMMMLLFYTPKIASTKVDVEAAQLPSLRPSWAWRVPFRRLRNGVVR